jgi:hypothetical protein
MKNVTSNQTLMSFAGSSMNLSEMKKVNGGGWQWCLEGAGVRIWCNVQLH